MAKEFQTVFEIAGKVAGSFDKSLLTAGKNLQQLQKQISSLSPADGNIAKFRQLKSELSTTETEYAQLNTEIAKMAKQMHASGPPTKKMAQEFEIAKLRAASLKQSITEQSAALHRQRQALAASGIQTTNLHGSMQKLANQQRLNAEAQQRINEIQQRAAAVEQRMLERKRQMIALQEKHTASIKRHQDAVAANNAARADMRGQMFDTAAIAVGAAAPVVMAAQFEKAMGGVAKQVAGARDESGNLTAVYYDMQKQIQALGRETPIATDQIAEMVAAGARMGVAKDELIGFTKTAAMMASAFELPAGELADQMGKIAGLYKIPIPAIGELADTINYLDDNAIAKGGDIISFLQRTGGLAGVVKVTGKEMAAIGSTLLTMGETTETAGTAVNALFGKFAAATKGTKGFQSALDEIGVSAEEIQSGMGTDAVATFQRIADAINAMPKDQQMGILVELAGAEHADTLSKLTGNMEEFRKQLAMANSEAAKGSMGKEYQATLATTDAQFKIMKNTMTEVAVNIGFALLPAVNNVMSVIGSAATVVADFSRENRTLVSVVGTVVAGMVALKVAALATGYAWTFVKGAGLALNGMLVATRAAYALSTGAMVANELVSKRVLVLSKLMTAAQWLWNAALAANPLGMVVIAIGAVIAAGVMLYQNWEQIKEGAALLWASIKQVWTDLNDWFANIDYTDVGIKILTTIGNGILQAGPMLVEKMKGVFNEMREYLPFSDAKKGPLSELTASGAAIMSTLGQGVSIGAPNLKGAVNTGLQDLNVTGAGIGATQGLSAPPIPGQQSGPAFTYSPTIQVTGSNADQIRQNVQGVLRDDRSAFERQLQQYMNNEARLSFA